jgi:Family of unknown function (DUF6441)
MKLAATIMRSLQAGMQAELRDIERAVATGTREAGQGLKTELRRQVTRAGLGARLGNSWHDKHYPEQARALSRDPNRERAEEGNRRQADQPEHLPGAPLWAAPVRASGKWPSLLVVDGLRASFSRKSGELRGFRRASERAQRSSQGVATVVMFVLVPQVKLSKRLDVARAAERWSGQLPALIEQQLRAE